MGIFIDVAIVLADSFPIISINSNSPFVVFWVYGFSDYGSPSDKCIYTALAFVFVLFEKFHDKRSDYNERK